MYCKWNILIIDLNITSNHFFIKKPIFDIFHKYKIQDNLSFYLNHRREKCGQYKPNALFVGCLQDILRNF